MSFYVSGANDSDRLGEYDTLGGAGTFLVSAGANAIVPGSGAFVGTALSLFGGMFGTNTEDKTRMARVQYFYDLAAGGNVAAAQLMAGAIPDVSGNEQPYWQHALTQLQTANPAVYNAAAMGGPIRTTGMGDSPENYPHMRAIALNWAANNAPVGVANPSSPASYTPGGTVVTRTAAQSLPGMTTTAGYNWMPVVAGVSAVALVAVFAFGPHRSRRR